ncbi:FtsX-like permease family protein [Paracidovorax wautersii]|uniref:ABC transport system permease protein n=1 Tax=Paracidovorax wautersii TaxID=1177982 RepID=A0ABU1IIT9_9BURK|nr:FtsX-like permease family protein [Paracidovorax wautersii]MDR6216358.1 putative ABC transport system permease protein [Paracidovorax wautersii]
MLALLRTFSWQELRHHPWRSLAAVVAVTLGVALGFAVHVINASALDEFSQAVRSVNGQPDLELRATQGALPESLYGTVAAHPQVALASPWLELTVQARGPGGAAGAPVALRVVGVDALVVPAVAPALMPRPAADAPRLAMLAPATVFLNAAAQQALGLAGTDADTGTDGAARSLTLQAGLQTHTVQVAGTVAAGGAPLAVMDIGAAQDLFARGGQLTRIDLQLRPGAQRAEVERSLQALPGWPAGVVVAEPGDAAQRVSNLSRAYRVNLTVLALVALFTGAFLVFSVLALSVAQRAPQFALLAVLGATPRQRLGLVLAESAALGLLGSLCGLALGTGLAALALQVLGGDLGGGYFAGVQPALQWSPVAAAVYGALGVAAALVGGWWPARQAQQLPPAQTLKGLGAQDGPARSGWVGLLLIAGSALLASAPPVFGIPLAAYAAVGLLLVGGIALLPWAVQALLHTLQPLVRGRVLPLLALERARRMRGTAAVAVGGVVASLSLAVALTVMVSSFRGSVIEWLDAVLPAPLYVRMAGTGAADDAAAFPGGFAESVARLPGVDRVQPLRVSSLMLDPGRPAVALLARPLGADPAQALPLVGAALPVPPGRVGVYVSEAIVQLYGVQPGADWPALSHSFRPLAQADQAQPATFFIAGVWRDYVRQFGAVAMDSTAFVRLTGDARTSDLALWPTPGADEAALRDAVTALAQATAGAAAATSAAPLEFTSAAGIRERSLGIFDRSFAVTYWLQAVAIGIGLFGIAASFSAQVLARRKEFGLLAHLGLTQRQVLAVVAGEGAAWTAIGAVAGTLLGLAVSVVLVHVVNPQSFHWTMELRVPGERLLALGVAVVAAGTVTAWLAGRAAAGRDAVMAVKEDW